VIENLFNFGQVLPKYFKTKNYASFVRQLNMYDFHKVKNKSGAIQFKNANFQRDKIENLCMVKRKHNNVFVVTDKMARDRGSIAQEISKVRHRIEELKESIKTTHLQNKNLMETNKEVVYQILMHKKESDLKSQKMLFLLHCLLSNYLPELMDFLKEVAFRLRYVNTCDLNDYSGASKKTFTLLLDACKRFSADNKESERLLNKLVSLFVDHIKKKERNGIPDTICQRQVKDFLNDLFARSRLFDRSNLIVPKRFDMRDTFLFQTIGDAQSTTGQDSFAFNDIKLDLKSENFCDLDISNNFSRNVSLKNMSLSEEENFAQAMNKSSLQKKKRSIAF
jgi:hypothetical protein